MQHLFPSRPSSSSSRDDAIPIHIFDIRRSNSVTELWRSFEKDSGSPAPKESRVRHGLSWSPKPNIMSFGQEREVSSEMPNAANESHPNNLRELWVKACNPPQLPPKGTFSSRNEDRIPAVTSSPPDNPSVVKNLSDFPPTTMSLKGGSSSLTAEGRRQVSQR
jgi:hypothetical protein